MGASTLASLHTYDPTVSRKTTAKTANGTTIQLSGPIKLPIQIGTHTTMHYFHTAADHECPAPLLLGSDFIHALNETGLSLSMDLHNRQLTIGADTLPLVQLNYINLSPITTYDVRITDNFKLPRRTNNVIPTMIEGLVHPTCNAFLIEDNLRPMDDLYVVGRALVSPTAEGKCFVNVLNPSQKDILLPDKLKIAVAHPAWSFRTTGARIARTNSNSGISDHTYPNLPCHASKRHHDAGSTSTNPIHATRSGPGKPPSTLAMPGESAQLRHRK
ncbi:hypothetical protein Aduo_012203 [Ancylostoma duodenale]